VWFRTVSTSATRFKSADFGSVNGIEVEMIAVLDGRKL
jgi:hypothetical protein